MLTFRKGYIGRFLYLIRVVFTDSSFSEVKSEKWILLGYNLYDGSKNDGFELENGSTLCWISELFYFCVFISCG